jgi:hypothetical protein
VSGVLRWEDPPPAHSSTDGKARQVIAHELIAFQLKRRPGDWAAIHEQRAVPSLANQINRGGYAPYRPAGSFEAVVRTTGDTFTVYARFVAPEVDR